MTDLERARLTYGVIRDFGWDVLWRSDNPIPDDAWPIDIVAQALAAGRQEGAEEMRERAARICDLEDCVRIKASALGTDIRALPLTPEAQ